jgi:hypothetical protein
MHVLYVLYVLYVPTLLFSVHTLLYSALALAPLPPSSFSCALLSLALVPITQISFSSPHYPPLPLFLSSSPNFLPPSSFLFLLFTKPPLHSFSGHSFLSSVIVIVIECHRHEIYDPRIPRTLNKYELRSPS